MRICLTIEYNGSNYHGWQKQANRPDLITVQGCVEEALSKVAASEIKVVCAGRTDVGVHAQNQVVHFDTEIERPLDAWLLGGNSNLPKDISIKTVKEVDDTFHARFSATARRYRYIIYNHKTRPAILNKLATWHRKPLDIKKMHKASQHLLGEHDFSSFRGCDCQSKTPMRNVHSLKVSARGKLVIIDIKANAFLLHMVRNIVGVLMDIGEGKKSPDWTKEVLQACDRRVASVTAPSDGLYLTQVYY